MTAIDRVTLPADVRAAAPEVRQRYAAGLLFERQLTTQLAKQLTATTAAAGPATQLLPDALADAIARSGGLGLARAIADLPAAAPDSAGSATAPLETT